MCMMIRRDNQVFEMQEHANRRIWQWLRKFKSFNFLKKSKYVTKFYVKLCEI